MELHPDIERTLLTSFIEDDYDGKLHMMTLNTNIADGDTREVVGIAFWREIDDDEMKEWLDLHRVEETLKRHGDDDLQQQQQQQKYYVEQHRPRSVSFQCPSDDRLSTGGKRRMEMIRNDSITWIRNALNTHNNDHDDNEPSNNQHHQTQNHASISPVNKLIHAWIKIELIAIKTTQRHHHYGEILLMCLLSCAHSHHETTHAILHIAGSSSNVAATKLYHKFGFVHLPRYEEGGPFEKPDGDLCVLGDIGGVLQTCPWEEMHL